MQQSTADASKETIPQIQSYQKILMAHDGSEMSDRALGHALYLSKVSGAELVILNVIDTDVIPPSAVLSFIKPDLPLEKAKEDLRSTLEGGVKQMLEQRVRACKSAGVSKVSPMVRAGKPVEEIISVSERENFDLIVMASGKITSTIRSLGSVARKVLDSTRRPVLIIHE